MQAIFAIQQTAAGAVFREQFVEAKILRGLFTEQFSGSFAIFRDQLIEEVSVAVRGVFADQEMSGLAIFRDQFWFDEEVPQPSIKTYMSLFASGKMRLVNGRILLINM